MSVIAGYEVDVRAPRLDLDSFMLPGGPLAPGVGREIEAGGQWVACMEDLNANQDWDYNDYCVLAAEAGGELQVLGGLSAYVGHHTAFWESGQVRFSGPEGSWATGSGQIWAAQVIEPRGTVTPEPATYVLLGAAVLFWGVWLAVWRKGKRKN